MDAVVLEENGSPRLVDRPRPEPGPGEVLVQIDRVGVDGTDREVIAGAHGGIEGSMVLGHEAVGTVADPNGTAFEAGETVVPTVRRPPGDYNDYFRRGEPDMAPMDATVECGIDGADGFLAEFVAVPSEFLLRLPERLPRASSSSRYRSPRRRWSWSRRPASRSPGSATARSCWGRGRWGC